MITKIQIGDETLMNNINEARPSIEEAKLILEEGKRLNPGPWVEHSIHVGKAAQLIARNCPNLDSEAALICGLLHDIGRRCGVTSMRHAIDGYNFLAPKGYKLPAKICITHSFPYKIFIPSSGNGTAVMKSSSL